MRLYLTEIEPKIDAAEFLRLRRLMPSFRREGKAAKRPQAVIAYSLAAYALREHNLGPDKLRREASGAVTVDAGGLYISLSHTKTHAFTALGEHPVGCDIETIRTVSPRVAQRICTPRELAEFTKPDDFFTFWCLKESWYKLHRGARKLTEAEFSIVCGVRCRTPGCATALLDIPGCACAVCASGGDIPAAAQHVSREQLLSLTEEL